jgi:hypothetical protein
MTGIEFNFSIQALNEDEATNTGVKNRENKEPFTNQRSAFVLQELLHEKVSRKTI